MVVARSCQWRSFLSPDVARRLDWMELPRQSHMKDLDSYINNMSIELTVELETLLQA